MAQEMALTRFRFSLPYIWLVVMDFGWFNLEASWSESLEKKSCASVPQQPYDSTTKGIDTQPNSLHFSSLVLRFLFSACSAADPVIIHATWIFSWQSGDVMKRSTAAGCPNSQLGMRISAGWVCLPNCFRLQAELLNMHADRAQKRYP